MLRPCSTRTTAVLLPLRVCTTPRTEHDACGVGFVVHIKGQRSHEIVRKALQVLINLEHRGACGCEANTGDGAGILIQTPDAFLRKVAPVRAAGGRRVRRRPRVPAARRARPRRRQGADCPDRRRGRAALLGWRDVPTDNRLVGDSARATQPVFQQLFIGATGRRRRRRGTRPVRAQAVRHPQARRACRRRAQDQRALAPLLLHRQPVGEHAHLQGHADRAAARSDVPGSRRSRSAVGARARASAFQHEHVSVVAAGAPVPLHCAQRRDQHAARQHQLDAGPRGAAPERPLQGRPRRSCCR